MARDLCTFLAAHDASAECWGIALIGTRLPSADGAGPANVSAARRTNRIVRLKLTPVDGRVRARNPETGQVRWSETMMNKAMKPMFLPDVEKNPQPGPYADAMAAMQRSGSEYPQIWHLFAYRTEMTSHLAQFTQGVLRGPAPLTPGFRELIAAWTSARNQCPF